MYIATTAPRFQRVKAPDKGELEELVHLISQRVGRCLERQGLLVQDTESAWLDLDPADTPMPCPISWAVPCRTGSPLARSRGEAFMIRTIRPWTGLIQAGASGQG